MYAFIINMDGATQRWDFVSQKFAATGISFERVAGIRGKELDFPNVAYQEQKYRWAHGKRTNPGEVGCYLSHIECLTRFLASEHDYAIICEDDVNPVPELAKILERAIEYVDCWDILRLSGFHRPHRLPFADLDNRYQLVVNRTRLCGSGAYMVHRHAAREMLNKMLPMFLPFDHALDREWAYGLTSACIDPLPISQEDHPFGTQISAAPNFKYPSLKRYLTVFPYRTWNESNRWLARTRHWRHAKWFAQRHANRITHSESIERHDRYSGLGVNRTATSSDC